MNVYQEFFKKALAEHCTILSDVSQEEDEATWLATRTKGIGGSDVGAICGVNNWSSARQIYLKKTGQFEDSVSEASKQRMHWGHMLEPIVADEFERQHPGLICVEAGATFKSNKYDFLLANVDRFVIGEDDEIVGILECKTASEMMNEEWAAGEVPMSYYYQVQHYLYVTGLERAWICCLVGGNKFYTYDIFFDEQLYTSVILPKLDEFWNINVLKLQETALQSADNELFDSLFTADTVSEESLDLPDTQYDNLGDRYMQLKAEIKEKEKELEAVKASIKEALQEHTRAYTPSYEITWAPRTRSSVDSSLLKASYPDIYEACLKTTSYRQIGVKRVVSDDENLSF